MVWKDLFLLLRLQHASSEQRPASGNCQQTHRNAEAGDPLGDLHAAEQPAVRRLVQPGCSHLPGTAEGGWGWEAVWGSCETAWLSVTHTGGDASFGDTSRLAHPPRSFMDYLQFSHFVSIRLRTSWRSWPRPCSPCRCWVAGWASTSGSRCWSWWLEWLSCRSSTASCLLLGENENSHIVHLLQKTGCRTSSPWFILKTKERDCAQFCRRLIVCFVL